MIISDNSIWKTSGRNIVKIHSTSRKIQGVKCGKSQIIFATGWGYHTVNYKGRIIDPINLVNIETAGVTVKVLDGTKLTGSIFRPA
jgi:hypothetical protein